MSLQKARAAEKVAPRNPSLLVELGVIGCEAIEPVILAVLAQGDPLLLIGKHGTGKSFLLNRLCAALWRNSTPEQPCKRFPGLAVKDGGFWQPGAARLIEAVADQVELPRAVRIR